MMKRSATKVLQWLALLLLTACTARPAIDPDDSVWAGKSIPALQEAMATGELSSAALARYFIDRVEALNPELRAVISVNDQAMESARRLDVERSAGRVRGPLHGIPVLIKDNIETREMPTTAGSLALADNVTGRDAPVVARLREAGAVILGKTNLSEWANFRSQRSSSGWSAVGGQTRNPRDLTRSPCGSSSGSAAAVAAGMVPVAVGTETNGSIVCPASATGIVGVKPTVGLVSRTHIVPISISQDTAGPLARSVEDAAIVLAAMAGEDPLDPATAAADARFRLDRGQLEAATLRGRRIGVIRSAGGYHEDVDALFDDAVNVFRSAGAEVVEDLELNPYEGFHRDAYTVLLYEFKAGLNRYLATLPEPFDALTLDKLIAFNEAHAVREMPYFRQEIFREAQDKGTLADAAYQEALSRVQEAARGGLQRLLDEHALDALIAPSYGPPWKIDLVTGDHFLGGFSSYPAVAGFPHITVPMGTVHGLPVGLSLTGPAFADEVLLRVAHAFERVRNTDGRDSFEH